MQLRLWGPRVLGSLEQAGYFRAALLLCTASGVAAIVAGVTASRRLRRLQSRTAVVVAWLPAGLTAHAASPLTAKRNGYRRHQMRLEATDELVEVRSYFWRNPGDRAQVFYDERRERHMFAGDSFVTAIALALFSALALASAVAFLLGPFR
jgi:hypothetical protein